MKKNLLYFLCFIVFNIHTQNHEKSMKPTGLYPDLSQKVEDVSQKPIQKTSLPDVRKPEQKKTTSAYRSSSTHPGLPAAISWQLWVEKIKDKVTEWWRWVVSPFGY